MRIISGKWRSRPLVSPAGATTRPTADRARETLFSMLTSRLGSFEGLTILDLFAGSGALALEAMSRGAAKAFMVEKDQPARRAIESNIRTLDADARLIGLDATSLPKATVPADVIFLDPPYKEGLVAPALRSALKMGWIAPHSWISVETAADEVLALDGFEADVVRKVGKAQIHLLRPQA